MKNENANKATPFPVRFLAGTLVLTGVVLAALVWLTFDSYQNATMGQLRNLRIEELRGTIVDLDEVLTMSARMAATTGDSEWERRYRRFEPQLDAAIKEAMELTADSDEVQAAAQTDTANLKLVEMENQAFTLVRAGDAARAKAVLFSDGYAAQKKIYTEGMNKLIQQLKEELSSDQLKKQREAVLAIIAVAICIVLLLFTWLSVLRSLNSWQTTQSASLDAITRAEEELHKLNDELEKRVEDRTRSLELEIRERKDAEAELLESEARKNAIVHSSLDCIVVIDHEGKILEFNPAAEQMFGHARAEVLGRELAEVIIPPSLRERHRQGMAHYLATGQARVIGKRIEINAMRSDGSEFPVELAITRMGAEGPPTFTGFLRDISERKQAEWQLNIQHAISRVLAESSTLKEASARILQTVCENLKWDVGEFWNVDQRAGVLRFDDMWIAPNIRADDFVAFSRQMTFARGVGLPGRVWESGKPVWIPDVAVDGNFPREAAANQVGLHGAFSIPIVAGNEVVGVIEFFSSEIRQPDEELLRMFAVLGSQLGQFFERKRAEAEVQQSQKRLRDIFDGLCPSMFVGLLTPEGILIEVNQSPLTAAGLKPEDVLGKPFDETPWWSQSPEAQQQLREAIARGARGEASRYDVRTHGVGNQIIDIDFSLQPLRDETGEVVFLIPSASDITERKNIEEALNASQELSRDLVENAIDIIYTHDLKGNYTSVNQAGERITGYTREESLKMNLTDVVVPEDRERAKQLIAAKLAGEELPAYELEILAKDGSRVAVEINTRILYENAVPVGVQGIARDVTERKQADKALEKSEEKFRELVENANDVIYTLDMTGNFTSLNRAGEELTGYSRTEAVRKSLMDVIAPEDVAAVFERFALNKQGAARPNFELGIIAKDGRKVTMDISSRLIVQDGMPVGLQGIGRDITESLKTRKELHRFNEKLQQSNRELQDFAYVASHDLQEPLRKVQAFSDRLRTKYADKLEGEGLDYLERMRSAANRMQMLIQDLLTFSRVSTKAQPFIPVNLETITKEVLSDLEVKVEETGATIEYMDLPTIDADPMQMRQLMQNLIGNALKFRQKDTAPLIGIHALRVEPNGSGGSGYCQIYVRDNGIGFDEKYADKIFAVFQRLHGRTEYEGSGVGLAICRKIAERHNGTITAQSLPDGGSTFIVTLPLKQSVLEIN